MRESMVNIGDDSHPVYACTGCNGEIVVDNDFTTFVHNQGCKYYKAARGVMGTAQRWAEYLNRERWGDRALLSVDGFGGVIITAADVRRWAALEQQAARLAALEAVAEIALTGHGDNPNDLGWRDGCLMCEALQALGAASLPAGEMYAPGPYVDEVYERKPQPPAGEREGAG